VTSQPTEICKCSGGWSWVRGDQKKKVAKKLPRRPKVRWKSKGIREKSQQFIGREEDVGHGPKKAGCSET